MSNDLLKIASTDVDDWPEATEALVRRFAVTPTQLAEIGQYAHDRHSLMRVPLSSQS